MTETATHKLDRDGWAVTEAVVGSAAPFYFAPLLTRYNIYPWIQEGDVLARTLVVGDEPVKAECQYLAESGVEKVVIRVKGERQLNPSIAASAVARLRWCLALDEDGERVAGSFATAASEDAVLSASIADSGFIRGKFYPTVFEALVGVICAQRIQFRRLYQMMESLSKNFGTTLKVDGSDYACFPNQYQLARASEEALRSCGLGYRAKYVLQCAREVVGQDIDLEALKSSSNENAEATLLALPGVGPYTARLVLDVGLRRWDVVHVDSFVRRIMSACYFKGADISDEQIVEYASAHWAGFASLAIGALTTDTHVWTKEAGIAVNAVSGAEV